MCDLKFTIETMIHIQLFSQDRDLEVKFFHAAEREIVRLESQFSSALVRPLTKGSDGRRCRRVETHNHADLLRKWFLADS